MPKLNKPRKGAPVAVKNRPVNFSRWPVRKTSRRYGLQSTLFASSPWPIMKAAVQDGLSGELQAVASSFINQAEDYFRAAQTVVTSATRPVLYYYSFLNIAKAYIVLRNKESRAPAKHGISERLPLGGTELVDATLDTYRTTTTTYNIFDSLKRVLTGSALPRPKTTYKVVDLLPQILQGHRIWCGLESETERFVSLDRIRILSNSKTKDLWLAAYVYADDLTRLGMSRRRFLEGSGLGQKFHEVECHVGEGRRKLLKFEQKTTIAYSHRPSDKLQELVDGLKPHLWVNITTLPPYRKYYVYVASDPSATPINQVLSIYALFYYLGSITRYRPHRYTEIMSGHFAPQLDEILANLPNQFAYLMASEFFKQEVAHAAII